ncbi:protein yippee [Clonorchis sinensis]|uniref:Protein yippee-like n=1 Tax=Clonorchis sinensis TaxID=79923 RepID=G7YXQ6_CLOSI|nr:protein yippee [Clonorchis sinensis]
MGRIFIEHLGGEKVFHCRRCGVPLSNDSEIVSTRFNGSSGRAYLFNRVVNISFSEIQVCFHILFFNSCSPQDRIMLTGRHLVRDVMCIKCNTKLGWTYEHAVERNEIYKEGRVILEEALFVESDGIADPLGERVGV